MLVAYYETLQASVQYNNILAARNVARSMIG